MKERTILLTTFVVLLLAFFSSSNQLTGQTIYDRMPGDINGDNRVSPIDLTRCMGELNRLERGLGLSTALSHQKLDQTGDGAFTNADCDLVAALILAQNTRNPSVGSCTLGEITPTTRDESAGHYGGTTTPTFNRCVLDPVTGKGMWGPKENCPAGEEVRRVHGVWQCNQRYFG